MDISYYLTYDLPIPYKNILIYPVTVKDYLLFNIYSQCFSFDKNTIPDPKIISMTSLEYLYYSFRDNMKQTPFLFWFDRILSLCIKDNNSFEDIEESMKRYRYDQKEKPFFVIGEEKYNSKDYEEIKSIICQQNLIELPDENVSAEVRESLEKARLYKEKLAGTKIGSFEDYIISLCVATGWTIEYVYSMTARKFINSIKRMDNLIHYKIYLTSAMSGMVEFKDKSFIKHWLANIEEEKYKDVSMDMNKIQDKISLESAKNK